jgi:hypothetical protein
VPPILDPMSKGVVNAIGSVALASLGLYFFFQTVPPASPDLLLACAGIGASLLIAYVVEAVWLVSRVEADEEYEEWLGFTVGAGIAGLMGIIFALLLSQHRAAGHANFLDELGAAWVAVSMTILGGVLVLQPVLVHRLSEPRRDDVGGAGRPLV